MRWAMATWHIGVNARDAVMDYFLTMTSGRATWRQRRNAAMDFALATGRSPDETFLSPLRPTKEEVAAILKEHSHEH
jgi:hypothetical protein